MSDKEKIDQKTSEDQPEGQDSNAAQAEPDSNGGKVQKVQLKSDGNRKRQPSFDSLRNEHDLLLICRSVLLVITGLLMLIPMPPVMLSVKFLIFIILAYASILNEKSIDEEHKARKDRSSMWIHVISYVALLAVVIMFMVLTINVSLQFQSMSTEIGDLRELVDSYPRLSLFAK